MLADLSKAFDCYLAINSYLTERKKRVKINDQLSSWLDIVVGVPQSSILGPLLFNSFLCDTFLFFNDVDFASYVNDKTPHCIGKTPQEVISQLEKSSKSILNSLKITEWKGMPGGLSLSVK